MKLFLEKKKARPQKHWHQHTLASRGSGTQKLFSFNMGARKVANIKARKVAISMLSPPPKQEKKEYLISNTKFSIIMAYYNRKAQLLLTLKSFEKLYGKNRYNLEVIIVDDMSDESEKITTIEKDFSFKIKLIELTNKTWSSPVIPYNIAINHISSDTDFIIIFYLFLLFFFYSTV